MLEFNFSIRLDTFFKKFQLNLTLFKLNTRSELKFSTRRDQFIDFDRTFFSSLRSHIHIEITFLQHHYRRRDSKEASERKRLSRKILMNLKCKLSVTCNDSNSLSSIALTFLIYIVVRKYRKHIAKDKSMLLAMKNEVKNDVKQ